LITTYPNYSLIKTLSKRNLKVEESLVNCHRANGIHTMARQKRKKQNPDSSYTDKLIRDTYFNISKPARFGGSKAKLYKSLKGKVSKGVIDRLLEKTDSYNLHTPLRKNFPRRKYIVSGINAMWQIDLTDLQQFSSENNGFKYILLCIDTFSRKAYGVPLKTKSGLEVSKAMREIIQNENNNTPPEMILSDRGKEVFNPQFKAIMK